MCSHGLDRHRATVYHIFLAQPHGIYPVHQTRATAPNKNSIKDRASKRADVGKSEKSPVSITAAERGSIDSSRGGKERRGRKVTGALRCGGHNK